MKTVMMIVVMLLSMTCWGQTTQSSNGLAMTDEQIRARLDAMNKKAATMPANDPATQPTDLSLRSAQLSTISQFRQAKLQQTQQINADGKAQLAAIDKQLAQVRADGQFAESKLNQLKQQQQAAADAARVSHSHGDIQTDNGSGTVDTTTVSEANAQIAAARFDPLIKDAQKAVDKLAEQQGKLIDQRKAVATEIMLARQQANVTANAQITAIGHWSVLAPTTRPTTLPTTLPSTFVPPEAQP